LPKVDAVKEAGSQVEFTVYSSVGDADKVSKKVKQAFLVLTKIHMIVPILLIKFYDKDLSAPILGCVLFLSS